MQMLEFPLKLSELSNFKNFQNSIHNTSSHTIKNTRNLDSIFKQSQRFIWAFFGFYAQLTPLTHMFFGSFDIFPKEEGLITTGKQTAEQIYIIILLLVRLQKLFRPLDF